VRITEAGTTTGSSIQGVYSMKPDLCHNFGILHAKYTKNGGTIYHPLVNKTANLHDAIPINHELRAKLVCEGMRRRGSVNSRSICEIIRLLNIYTCTSMPAMSAL
jgi:hypothetical protein